MAAQILDGKVMSETLRKEIAERTVRLKEQGVTPGLAVILVGDDPASEIYVRNKGNGCAEVGIYSRTIRMCKAPCTPWLNCICSLATMKKHVLCSRTV